MHPGDRSTAGPGALSGGGRERPPLAPPGPRVVVSLLPASCFCIVCTRSSLLLPWGLGRLPTCLPFTGFKFRECLQTQGSIRPTLISQTRKFSATGQATLTPARLHRGWAHGVGPEA